MANKSTAKYLRVPPRKARVIAAMVRGKDATQASAILKHTRHKSALMISKVLKSAVSNAVSTGKVDPDNLFIQAISVDPGPILKRFTQRAMGRGTRVNKRTSHITVTLGER